MPPRPTCTDSGGARAPAPPPPPAHGRPSPAEAEPEVVQLQVRWDEAAGLDYMEVVVGDVDVNDPLPLILGLHGLGDRPHVPDEARLGEGLAYRIVMPRAPERWGATGYTWLPVRVRDGKIDVLSESLADEAQQLAAFLEAVQAERPTIGRPVVTGGSQGGMLTFALAVRHPAAVAGAVPVMGWLPPPLVPDAVQDAEAYPPIYAVHGEADRIIPVGPTERSVDALRSLGLDVRLETFEGVGHHMSDPMDVQVRSWLGEMLRAQLATARRPAWR